MRRLHGCVTECPDTAILGKAIPKSSSKRHSRNRRRSEALALAQTSARTKSISNVPAKKGDEGALFGIFIDPTKCKGCAECVQVCDEQDSRARDGAEERAHVDALSRAFNFFRRSAETPKKYINEKLSRT